MSIFTIVFLVAVTALVIYLIVYTVALDISLDKDRKKRFQQRQRDVAIQKMIKKVEALGSHSDEDLLDILRYLQDCKESERYEIIVSHAKAWKEATGMTIRYDHANQTFVAE